MGKKSSSQPSEIVVAHPNEPHPVRALPDLIKNMREDAENISDNNNLDAFINDIFTLLEALKESESQKSKKSKKKSSAKESQNKAEKRTNKFLSITSAGLLKLKDLLLEGVNGICSLRDVLPVHEASKVARDVLQGLGQAHWVTSGFLLIVYIIDRFETLSSNQKGCLDLLEQMYYLAVDIKNLTGREDLAESGIKLIVEACLMCCTQIDRSGFSRIWSTTVEHDDLLKFKEKLKDFNLRMIRGMGVWLCSKFGSTLVPPPRPKDQVYPDHAVGIDEPLKSVKELLQWESEERAVAVIVHGFGGIGKSTLADAVFASSYVEDCKYSVVRLDSFRDIGNSEIVELQKIILKDLMSGIEEDETLGFDDYMVGWTKIGKRLEEEKAFLYIDNVVDRDLLQKLLPTRKLKDAKKLRVLITARNRDVMSGCKMKIKPYDLKTLSPHHARTLLINEMYNNVTDGINGQITDSQLEKIVEISCGIPQLLVTMGGFIESATDKSTAYDIIMEDSENLTGNTFERIDKYIFAYDGLPAEYKLPFLDICFFLRGWEWETVGNIVGVSALDALEKRALVSKGKDMTLSLHDIIFKIAKEKAQDGELKARHTRIDFTKATYDEIAEFFEKMQDMKFHESVKGLWLSDQAYNISVEVLSSMHNSLRIFGHKVKLDEGQCEKTFNKLLVYKGETQHFPFKWSLLKNIRFLSYQPKNLELLQEIPSSNLRHIELDGSLCSVSEIFSSDIQQLQALQVLRLINFHNLEKLPEEWGEYLRKNLKELTLSHCTAMKRLPASISELKVLKLLKLDNCWNLKRWPKGCESLSSLKKFKIILWNCPILTSLPSCFVENLDSDSKRLFQNRRGILSDSPHSEALDSDSMRLFQDKKGIQSDPPQSDSDSDYESDED